MAHEGHVARGERPHSLRVLRARVLDERGQEQCPRIVVETVPVFVARDREDGVLEQARLIAHEMEVLEADLGKLRRPRCERLRLEDRSEPIGVLCAGPLDTLHVASCHCGPRHAATVGRCAFTESEPLHVIPKQANDLGRDGLRISPGHEDAAPLREEFTRVQVGRRDDRLPGADRVRQCARGDLLRLQIRRDVDVRRGEKFDEFTLAHEAIVKDHAGVHAEPLCA